MYKEDNAINYPIEDKLGNKVFSFYLAQGIINLKCTSEAFVIGLCGGWGDGKTSIINMCLKYLKYLYKNPNLTFEEINQKLENDKCDKKKKNSLSNILSYVVELSFLGLFTIVFYFLFYGLIFLYNQYAQIYSSICSLAVVYFIFEKFSIPIFKILSEDVQIIYPLKKIKNFFFPEKNIKPIIINFKPWNFTNSEKILEKFFSLLEKEINNSDLKCYSNLTALIKLYSKSFLNIDLSVFDKLQDKNIIDIKNKIERILKECNNRKIIVIIDDIDRLLPEEIITIFKTVKIIADFPNIIYVLSFDKVKTIEILENHYKFNAHDYIKKIIQVEKNIPPIENDILKDIFINNLKELVNTLDETESNDINNLYDYALKNKYIFNLRDLNKFYNTFGFIYSAYKYENINLRDLIAITAVEVFEPSLYKFIWDNKNSFSDGHIFMKKPDNCWIQTNDKINIWLSLLDFVIELKKYNNIDIIILLFPNLFKDIKEKNYNDYAFSSNNNEDFIEEIQEFITFIKNKPEYLFNSDVEYRRINDYKFFDNYYRVNFDKKTITSAENKKLINLLKNIKYFKNEFYKLFKINPNKPADFLRGWYSIYNNKNRTKKNSLLLVENLLAIDSMEVISSLDNNYSYFYFIPDIIKNYNEENPDSKILISDVYKIIQAQIQNIEKNCLAFLFTICRLYIFPLTNPPIKNDEEQKILDEIKDIINKKITKKAILNDNKSMKCLDYLYHYFNGNNFVVNFITEILQDGQEENLLKVLLTGNNVSGEYMGYGYVYKFFKDYVSKDKELKNKLLDIYYSDKYKNLMSNKIYYCEDDYIISSKEHIVKEILKLFVDNFDEFNNDNIFAHIQDKNELENILNAIEEKYGNSTNEEIKFIKEISFKNSTSELIKKLRYIRECICEYPILFEKYEGTLNKLIEG